MPVNQRLGWWWSCVFHSVGHRHVPMVLDVLRKDMPASGRLSLLFFVMATRPLGPRCTSGVKKPPRGGLINLAIF